ncbi:MAG: glycosyltransferase family 2 protein [Deltaproteobacteria bacterium]|nr:glycosyltransferase family 2 protein [Deltaproteobacteria bacterium]
MGFELLSIVIPVYRSEKVLERTVKSYVEFFAPRQSFELVLVNDGSPDGAQRVIERLAEQDSRIRWIEHGTNLGQHAAVLRGMGESRGDVVVTVDDDGQNPPESAQKVIEELERANLDVCYGRFQQIEQAVSRRLASKFNGWLTRRTLGNQSDVVLSNVRAIKGDLARAVGLAHTSFPYVDARLFRSTRRVGNVDVEHLARDGESTYTLPKLVGLWVSHLTSLTTYPLELATVGCFSASLLGLVVGIVQFVRVMIERQAPPGWLSLFLALTFLFSLLFAFLGVLSIYVSRLYIQSNAAGLVWIRSRGGSEPSAAPESVEEQG